LDLTADRFIGGGDYSAWLWQLARGVMAFRWSFAAESRRNPTRVGSPLVDFVFVPLGAPPFLGRG